MHGASFATVTDNEERKGQEVSVIAVLVACIEIGKLNSCCLLFFTSRICDGMVGPLQHSIMYCCLQDADVVIGQVDAAAVLQF